VHLARREHPQPPTHPLPHCHTHISANNTPNHPIRGSRDSHCQSATASAKQPHCHTATPISQPILLQITPFQALETANQPQPHLVSTATLPGVSCHSHSHTAILHCHSHSSHCHTHISANTAPNHPIPSSPDSQSATATPSANCQLPTATLPQPLHLRSVLRNLARCIWRAESSPRPE
jgi:hypothetical protein